ncbi:MAG: hypothetical protein WC436_02120 [Candidatus Babeliales bacterium]
MNKFSKYILLSYMLIASYFSLTNVYPMESEQCKIQKNNKISFLDISIEILEIEYSCEKIKNETPDQVLSKHKEQTLENLEKKLQDLINRKQTLESKLSEEERNRINTGASIFFNQEIFNQA